MSDLESRFVQAVAQSVRLPKRPDNPTLLRIYALYKQATLGDTQHSPSFGEMVARAKWKAWMSCQGMSAQAAKQAYVALIEELQRSTQSA